MEIKVCGTYVNWKGEEVFVPYVVREDDEIFIHDYIADGNDNILMYYVASHDGINFYCIKGFYFYPASWIKLDCGSNIKARCREIENAAVSGGYVPFSAGQQYKINTGGY